MTASENLDLVRSIYAAWPDGEYSSSDWAHPEIEYVIADGPSPARSAGLSGMAEAWGSALSAWEGVRSEPEDYRTLDGERVLVLDRAGGGHGKTSGLALGKMWTRERTCSTSAMAK